MKKEGGTMHYRDRGVGRSPEVLRPTKSAHALKSYIPHVGRRGCMSSLANPRPYIL